MWDWFVQCIPVAFAIAVAVTGWRVARRVLGFMDDGETMLHSVPDEGERQLRLSQARLRRLRTVRYEAEHAAWDSEFSALYGGCPHCSARSRDLASRFRTRERSF
jgi:hypothetical protein